MKNILKSLFVNFLALNFAVAVVPGITNSGGTKSLAVATIIYSFINIFVKPIISLLLLPINLITLGTFKWLINVIALLILASMVSNLDIKSFSFTGFEYQGFVVPKIVISRFFVLVLGSAAVSSASVFLFWLFKDND
jgi:putative membrane protein